MSHKKDKVTGKMVQDEEMTERLERHGEPALNCPLVPGGTRPSRSRPCSLS